MFFGLTAIGYEAGVVGYIIGLAYAIGLVLLGWQSPRIKKVMESNNYDTLDEFIGGQFGSIAQTATSIVNLVFFLMVLAAQFVAMTVLLTTFISGQPHLIFVLATAVVIAYTASAGFKGVLLTDVWQFLIVAAAVILSFGISVVSVGSEVITALPASHFTGTAFGVVFVMAVLLLFPLSILVRTDLWQRVASAKNSKTVKRAFYSAAPTILVFYFLLTSLGMFARARLPNLTDPDQSGLQLVLSLVGGQDIVGFEVEILLAVFAVGILSALISTIDTNLNVISVALSKLARKDRWKKYEGGVKNKTRTRNEERSLLRFTRVITVTLGVTGAVMAFVIPDIVDLIVSAGAVILIFLPSVLGALLFDHDEPVSASSSIILGFAAFVIALLALGDPTAAFVPGAVIALLVYSLVRYFAT